MMDSSSTLPPPPIPHPMIPSSSPSSTKSVSAPIPSNIANQQSNIPNASLGVSPQNNLVHPSTGHLNLSSMPLNNLKTMTPGGGFPPVQIPTTNPIIQGAPLPNSYNFLPRPFPVPNSSELAGQGISLDPRIPKHQFKTESNTTSTIASGTAGSSSLSNSSSIVPPSSALLGAAPTNQQTFLPKAVNGGGAPLPPLMPPPPPAGLEKKMMFSSASTGGSTPLMPNMASGSGFLSTSFSVPRQGNSFQPPPMSSSAVPAQSITNQAAPSLINNNSSSQSQPNTSTINTSSFNSVGVIFPPADLRSIIDTTAEFVAKNGPEFENRVMRESTQRFSFLFPNNPYRAYYELKVKEYKTGEEVVKPSIPQAILDIKQKEEQEKQRKEKILALTDFSHSELEAKPPQPDVYAIQQPLISPVDIDVIKTTAQFVARNGQRFLTGLTQRERNNPQFDFLKPSHALFTYFTSLVDSYTKCLMPPKEQLEKLKSFASDLQNILQTMYVHYRWEVQQEKTKKEKEDSKAEERNIIASIDWHDFVIVETIDFTNDDDNLPLAAPIDFTNLKAQVLPPLESSPIPTPADSSTPILNIGLGEMEIDEEDMEVDIDAQETSSDITKNQISDISTGVHTPIDVSQEPIKQELPKSDGEIKVVTNYTRQKRAPPKQIILQKCPLTGQMIPADKMTEHLNTLLLDPRWKEEAERRKLKARKHTAFAPAEDIGSYLSAFASKRPDMFGSVEEEIKEHSDPLGVEAPPIPLNYETSKSSLKPPPPPPPINNISIPPPTGSLAQKPRSDMEPMPDNSLYRQPNQSTAKYTIRCLACEGLSAQTLTIETDNNLNIIQFKKSLIDAGLKTFLLPNQLQMRDMHSNTLLMDDRTLASYNLSSNSVILMFKA